MVSGVRFPGGSPKNRMCKHPVFYLLLFHSSLLLNINIQDLRTGLRLYDALTMVQSLPWGGIESIPYIVHFYLISTFVIFGR